MLLTQAQITVEQGKPKESFPLFKRIRLDGPWSNQALLTYGNAALKADDPLLALSAWGELAKRPARLPEVREVLLSLGKGFEGQGARSQALQAYEDAYQRFIEQNKNLEQLRSEITPDSLFEQLVSSNQDFQGWLSREQTLSPSPSASLSPLMSTRRFFTLLKQVRDLQLLKTRILAWQDKTDSFETMLVTRQRARAEQLARINGFNQQEQFDELIQKRNLLGRLINDKENVFQFATPFQVSSLKRYQGGLDKLYRLKRQDHPRYGEFKQRMARVFGALYWEVVTEHPAQYWLYKNGLNQLDQALVDGGDQNIRLKAAMALPKRYGQMAQQVDDIKQNSARILGNIEQSLSSGKKSLAPECSGRN